MTYGIVAEDEEREIGLAAEKQGLGACLVNNELFRRFSQLVREDDLARREHRLIYRAMGELSTIGATLDPIPIRDKTLRHGGLDGGLAYICSLTDGVPPSADIDGPARIIRRLARRRRLDMALERHDLEAAHKELSDLVDDDAGPDGHTRQFEQRVAQELDRERTRTEARRRLALEARGATPAPSIMTLRDRLARPRPPLTYRIEGWQPRDSRVMLTAQFKAGKTTFVGNYIASIVDGRPFLGRYGVSTVSGVVALVDTEMSGWQLDDWLKDQRIQRDDRVLVMPLRGALSAFDLLDPIVRGQWAEMFKAQGVEVLILDCLRPLLDVFGLDEHRDAGRLLVAIDQFIAEAGISEAVIVHHMGHGAERARGDSRLRDWPDAEWRLVREDDTPSAPRFVTAYGRDVDIPESRLEFDPGTRRLSIAGGSRRDVAAGSALEVVLDVLRSSDEALSVRAIQTALSDSDYPRDTVRRAIKDGVSSGAIVTEPGAHRALLHRAKSSVCGSVRQCAGTPASECAGAYIAPHTRTLDGATEVGQ